MKIAIAQIDPIVGAFDLNFEKIKKAYHEALKSDADLMITPELSLCGYPPLDLLVRPEIFQRTQAILDQCLKLTEGQSCALCVGHVTRNDSHDGRIAKNDISVIENGKVSFRQSKRLLPTYDVFDEARYFEPGEQIEAWTFRGRKIAFGICEDLWASDPTFKRRIYKDIDPVEEIERLKPEIIISISASPYQYLKKSARISLHQKIAERVKAPLIYINQSGSTDEILFDGASFVVDAHGKFAGRLPSFQTQTSVVEISPDGEVKWHAENIRSQIIKDPMESLVKAIVSGMRDYFHRTGFEKAVIGLSGGIDSALVAALAVKAFGPKNVIGIAMPGPYSSSHSIEDAQELGKQLGIHFRIKPIKFLFSTFKRELSEASPNLSELALENLQARIRGILLMTVANSESALTLVTSNKSELAVGYSTLYGDMCGAIAPIGDIFKTRVFEMARWINTNWGDWIPKRSIEKPPSAELRPDQKDTDTLPPYSLLDQFLEAYLEENREVSDLEGKIEAQGQKLDRETMNEVVRRIERSEFKRRQAAPVLRVSPRAFGIGRRIPIAKLWNA